MSGRTITAVVISGCEIMLDFPNVSYNIEKKLKYFPLGKKSVSNLNMLNENVCTVYPISYQKCSFKP